MFDSRFKTVVDFVIDFTLALYWAYLSSRHFDNAQFSVEERAARKELIELKTSLSDTKRSFLEC